jgi:hypothetical protein
MEPLYASALVLTGLTNVVQMYKTAIDRFMAQLIATSSWELLGRMWQTSFSLELSGSFWLFAVHRILNVTQHTIGSSGIKSGHRAGHSQVALRFWHVYVLVLTFSYDLGSLASRTALFVTSHRGHWPSYALRKHVCESAGCGGYGNNELKLSAVAHVIIVLW